MSGDALHPSSNNPASFLFGNIPVEKRLILAPMDGLTDSSFRRLARRIGSIASYTEFINAIDVVKGHPFLKERITFFEDERPLGYQIFDNDPDRFLAAAKILRRYNPDFIDVNMGCSSPTVSARGAGAGLLRDPLKVARLISKLVKEIDLPITAKIRLGWDRHTRNYLEISRAIADHGGRVIAVHARTREQRYTGSADWDAIAEIKQISPIPVIGNGDVQTVADIDRLLDHTHCDGVMIGRAAILNPWIFARFNRKDVPLETVEKFVITHLRLSFEQSGSRGLILIRKYLVRYFREYPQWNDWKNRIYQCDQEQEVINHLTAFFQELRSGK
ncbi:MAG TPA: tRNA-dihydrouridine synthase family protein [Anaerolineaceae bacterium]